MGYFFFLNEVEPDGSQITMNTALALCTLSNQGYRHTFGIYNTYCFSTATMVTRTRLNVTLYVQHIACLLISLTIHHSTSSQRCYLTLKPLLRRLDW
jgi:hypothetical protein